VGGTSSGASEACLPTLAIQSFLSYLKVQSTGLKVITLLGLLSFSSTVPSHFWPTGTVLSIRWKSSASATYTLNLSILPADPQGHSPKRLRTRSTVRTSQAKLERVTTFGTVLRRDLPGRAALVIGAGPALLGLETAGGLTPKDRGIANPGVSCKTLRPDNCEGFKVEREP